VARVLVTGVSGQIGSYVADLLLEGGHDVVGAPGPDGLALPDGVRACKSPLTSEGALDVLEEAGRVDAVIHLAGQSSVAASWRDPMGTFNANAKLAAGLLFAVAKRQGVRFIHASSAEIFGNAPTPVQNEATPFAPISPYAVAKASAHMAVQVARSGMGIPATNLIFYLGESPRRAPRFVFRKITMTLAAMAHAKQNAGATAKPPSGVPRHLELGNTAVIRDFCHAKDLARAAVMLSLGGEPGDYICASGDGHSILDVACVACDLAGLDPDVTIRSDPALIRPNDIASLVGDASKLRALGWAPTVGFRELVTEIYEYDVKNMDHQGD
jgi:GDPmannose 4,6-dehydratase